jgi:hypothetical protein
MGLSIVVKGADFSNGAVGYIPPVPNGLQYLNIFGGEGINQGRNLALGKSGAEVVGAPVVGQNSATFVPLTSYIQTSVADSDSITMMVVARSPVPRANTMIVSNYGSNRKAASGTTFATSLMMRPQSAPNAEQTYEEMGASEWDGANSSSSNFRAASMLRPIGGIQALVGRREGVATSKWRRVDNKTAKTSAVSTPIAGTVFDLGQPYRVGCGYTQYGSLVGPEVFFAAIWDRALTDAEVETMYQAVKAYYAGRGIVI